MSFDPDLNPNDCGPTGPGMIYNEQPPEPLILTELKLFIEAGFNEFNQSISQQLAVISEEIHVLAVAAQNGQGRSSTNNVFQSRLERLLNWASPVDASINPSSIFNDYERKICDLQSANKSLIEERAHVEQEKRHLMIQTETLQNRLAEVEHQKHQLQNQNTKFRDIFVKNGQNDNELVDAVIIRSFCDLREQIQRIVQKQYSAPPNPVQIYKGELFEDQKAFFRQPRMHQDAPNATKIFVMRAQLFRFLQAQIFQRPTFGLYEDLEEKLAIFEEALVLCGKGKAPDIHEWRRRTIECANWLDGQNKIPQKVAKYIATFMEPLLLEPSKDTLLIHFESIRHLCEDAYKLTLILRKSTSDFKCESVPKERIIDESLESQISPQAFDPPSKSQAPRIQGSRIALTIFGALVKYEPATGERFVLVKPHVVCRE